MGNNGRGSDNGLGGEFGWVGRDVREEHVGLSDG